MPEPRWTPTEGDVESEPTPTTPEHIVEQLSEVIGRLRSLGHDFLDVQRNIFDSIFSRLAEGPPPCEEVIGNCNANCFDQCVTGCIGQIPSGFVDPGVDVKTFCEEQICGNCCRDHNLTSCSMQEQNGMNALAATAIAETDGGGTLFQNNVAVAALMLMQVNSFRAGGWRQLGTFAGQQATPLTIVADQSQTQIIDIATLMVDGYCQNADPLSQFNANNYPAIANSDALATIAGNIDARFEISIDASRVEQFRSDPDYPLQFVITAEGADRAIVIGDANITNAWIEYQCPIGQNHVVGTSQNPDELGTLQVGVNVTCQPCIRSTRQWWYNSGNGDWELLSETQFQERIRSGGQGYIASCSTS